MNIIDIFNEWKNGAIETWLREQLAGHFLLEEREITDDQRVYCLKFKGQLVGEPLLLNRRFYLTEEKIQ